MATLRLSQRHRALALAWIVSLALSAAIGRAATQRDNTPTIVSGADIGFRVEKITPTGGRAGRLVVRIDGKWVDAELAPSMAVRPAR
jgi:hypothetical protein